MSKPGAVLHGDEVRGLEGRFAALEADEAGVEPLSDLCYRFVARDAISLASRLQSENAELRAACAFKDRTNASLQGCIKGEAHLQSELDRLRGCERDAERYRWLRARHWTDGGLVVTKDAKLPLGTHCPSKEFLDAAIDAATEARTLRTESGSRSDEQGERKESVGGRTSG